MSDKSKRQKVSIDIRNETDGEVIEQTVPGEYMFSHGEHVLAYQDLIGNALTDTGLVFTSDMAILHRNGAITGDMIFEPGCITPSRDYSAFEMPTMLRVHTTSLSVDETSDRISLSINYKLYIGRSKDVIECWLKIGFVPV